MRELGEAWPSTTSRRLEIHRHDKASGPNLRTVSSGQAKQHGVVWGGTTIVDLLLWALGNQSGAILIASVGLAAFISGVLLLTIRDHTTRRSDTRRSIFLFSMAAVCFFGSGLWTSSSTAKKLLEAQRVIETLPLTSGLYKSIPGTADLIVRGFSVDQNSESTVFLSGPVESDSLVITVSAWRRDGEEYFASLRVSGTIGTSEITGGTKRFEVKAGSVSPPIYATTHAFYVYVDETKPGSALISVARRDLGVGDILRDIIAPLGAVVFETPEPPPIFDCAKP